MSFPPVKYSGFHTPESLFNQGTGGDPRYAKKGGEEFIKKLVNDPDVRAEFMSSEPLTEIRKRVASEPVRAHDDLTSYLQQLNGFKAGADWDTIDQAFGNWIDEQIHATNVELNQLELANPDLRPHGNDYLSELVRSPQARDDLQANTDTVLAGIRKNYRANPDAELRKTDLVIKDLKTYAALADWTRIDPEFGTFIDDKLKEARDLREAIVHVHDIVFNAPR